LKIFFFLFFFYSGSLWSFNLVCNFEEVYQNGDIQQGTIWFQNEDFRYQYDDIDLYTIISKNKNFFLIDNKYQNVQRVSEKNDTFALLLKVFDDFPNFKEVYQNEKVTIKIENSDIIFIRRISIISNQANLSLNFYSCKNKSILEKKYFDYLDFKKYKY